MRIRIIWLVLLAAAVLTVHATAQEPTEPPRELSGDEVQALFERGREIREQAQDATNEPTREELLATIVEMRQQRFQLFNNCESMTLAMDLQVENYADADADTESVIGLTADRIRTLAESRLRVARLYDADAATWLYVNVNVQGRGFSLSLEYKKSVYDAVSGETNYATTWRVGGAGTHSGDAGFILQGLSEYLDGFILDYLRVNEAAC